jgi:hypothetical protein
VTETTAQPTGKATTNGTLYIVLTRDPTGHWTEGPTIHATSATEAIRQAASEDAGQYVAIPKRSWHPVTVTLEQKTVVKIGDTP